MRDASWGGLLHRAFPGQLNALMRTRAFFSSIRGEAMFDPDMLSSATCATPDFACDTSQLAPAQTLVCTLDHPVWVSWMEISKQWKNRTVCLKC